MSGYGWFPTNVVGFVLEIPIRGVGIPANLWVHWAGNCTFPGGFPPLLTDSDWHPMDSYVITAVADTDVVLAGQASVELSWAHREETSAFNTDNWGMAFDSLPANAGVVFPLSVSTRGNCFPIGAAARVDLLVMRPSLIPPVPPPYGTYPNKSKPSRPSQQLAGPLADLPGGAGDHTGGRSVLRSVGIQASPGALTAAGAGWVEESLAQGAAPVSAPRIVPGVIGFRGSSGLSPKQTQPPPKRAPQKSGRTRRPPSPEPTE
jgi:hypothetical protein